MAIGLQISFLRVLGLSVQNSRNMRADMDLLTWQVLLGGLGSGVCAHWHLHLRAEHSGSCLGALVRGSHAWAGGGPPWVTLVGLPGPSREASVIPS